MQLQDLRNDHGERIDFSFREGRPGVRDLVVIGHGVTGNKDRPFAVALADGIGDAGVAALRVSFSGNGASEGDFRASTVSKEVADLGCVLDRLDGWNVGYVGHSMGAAVGLLRASEDPRIRYLVSLGGMVEVEDFAQRKFGDVVPDEGFMWDLPECPLSRAYMDDMRTLGSLMDRADTVRVPWLLVHGTADTVVPIRDSREAYARAGEPKKLHEIEGCDHVFSEHMDEMVTCVVEWLRDVAGVPTSA